MRRWVPLVRAKLVRALIFDSVMLKQFAVLIGQIQAPEDVVPPLPISPPATVAVTTPGTDVTAQVTPPAPTLPAQPPTPVVPPRPSFLRFLWHHIRSDPSARLCMLYPLMFPPPMIIDDLCHRDTHVVHTHLCFPCRDLPLPSIILCRISVLSCLGCSDIPLSSQRA